MIVRISRSGKSFRGLGTYLLHDPKAATSARVAWTHTLNLANDLAPAAIAEMIQTARNAELLKQEAGVRAGGRKTLVTVKHVSLNWPSGEQVSREEMIYAAESFLARMGWNEHQVLLVAHSDRHSHLHLMINAVHPVTGLALKDGLERRHAQAWALAYEQQQGTILCGGRLKPQKQRRKAPSRDAWQAFESKRRAFAQQERLRHIGEPSCDTGGDRGEWRDREWRLLKAIQRDERKAFFATGKVEFSVLRLRICRQVRDECRPRWRDYYALRKSGIEASGLKIPKQNLIHEQRAALEKHRDKSCRDLRYARDQSYRLLLDTQADARRELRQRQHAGLDSTDWLAKLRSPEASAKADKRPIVSAWRHATLTKSHMPAGWIKSESASPICGRSKTAHATMRRAIDTSHKTFRLLSAVADQNFARASVWAGAAAVNTSATSPKFSRSAMVSRLTRPASNSPQQPRPASRCTAATLPSSHNEARNDLADTSIQDECDAAMADVNEFYARKMHGLRNSGLPSHLLPAAIMALMEERRAAIAAVKERRRYKQRGRRLCDRWMDAS